MKKVPSATADFIHKVLGVYPRSMKTIYLSIVHTGTGDFMKKILLATWALWDRYIAAIE